MAKITPDTAPRTADHILDVAERLAQTRGFNGFSYADIAAEVGITKASLHYHFPTKAELGSALIARYTAGFQGALASIATSDGDVRSKLERYVLIYREVLGAGRMCLCGMLAAEYETLPAPMQAALRAFFDQNEHWLAAILEDGRRTGELTFVGAASEIAGLLTGALEGSMLLARSYGDDSRFGAAVSQLLATLAPATPAR